MFVIIENPDFNQPTNCGILFYISLDKKVYGIPNPFCRIVKTSRNDVAGIANTRLGTRQLDQAQVQLEEIALRVSSSGIP
jgi:hypothetical protein